MAKRVLAPLLLLVFLINTLGYYIIFEVNRYMIRKEMAASIPGSMKITVIESKDPHFDKEIRWVDRREFIYKGNLYDVIYTSIRKTRTIFYCLHDKKEENLVNVFRHANTSKISQALWSLMISVALPVPSMILESSPSLDVHYPQFISHLTSIRIPPGNPPPEISS